jgi:predicted RNase H-like nuclease (RuvC/YqgF family)
LEEVIKSKDTFADPQEVRIIEERFQQQEMAINNLRIENNDLVLAFNAKEEELRQAREILDKQKKGVSKDSTRLKRLIKDKDRDIVRMRGELQI